MKTVALLLMTALGLISDSCSNPPIGPTLAAPRIVASHSYMNFAWDYRHYAFYIDSSGAVWYKDYVAADSVSHLVDTVTVYTPAIFDKLLAGAVRLDTVVKKSELNWMENATSRVARGTWDSCSHTGSDMGTDLTAVYLATGQDQAKQIRLKCWGDITCKNDHSMTDQVSDKILSYEPRRK